jgi:predicted alpha-1,6-mannanase (GH76 family)
MHRSFLLACAWFFLAATSLPAETKIPELPPRADVVARVKGGAEVLNKLYWSPALCIWLDRTGDDVRGHFEGRVNPPWWSCANVVETLLDYMNATGTADFQPMLASLYDVQRDVKNRKPRAVAELKRRGQWSDADEKKWRQREADAAKKARERKPDDPVSPRANYGTEFRNEYLDDSGWWGVAWLKMYDRTHEAKYLATARAIHAHMARNWRPDKDGGILWCEDADKQHPNSITNSLFIILSARLYERTHEAADLKWAEQGLAWFRAKALYDGTAVVDQPGHKGDYWTYNQGCYLGALVALHRATGKVEYLDEAAKAVETILSRSGVVLPSGVIFEKLGTSGWDPGLFKGVFARYLGQLRDALGAAKQQPELVGKIDGVLRTSAASVIAFGKGEDGQYGIAWQEGGGEAIRNFNTQAAALALFVATLGEGKR